MKMIPEKWTPARFVSESAIYIALAIVLTRFASITLIDMRFSFAFLVFIISAMRMGPWPTALVSFLTDFLGAYLFPVGPPHYGLMLVALLSGLAYGLFLYGEWNWKRIALLIFVEQFLLHTLLNSYFLMDFTHNPFWVTVAARLPQQILSAVLKVAFLVLIRKSPYYQRIRTL